MSNTENGAAPIAQDSTPLPGKTVKYLTNLHNAAQTAANDVVVAQMELAQAQANLVNSRKAAEALIAEANKQAEAMLQSAQAAVDTANKQAEATMTGFEGSIHALSEAGMDVRNLRAGILSWARECIRVAGVKPKVAAGGKAVTIDGIRPKSKRGRKSNAQKAAEAAAQRPAEEMAPETASRAPVDAAIGSAHHHQHQNLVTSPGPILVPSSQQAVDGVIGGVGGQ